MCINISCLHLVIEYNLYSKFIDVTLELCYFVTYHSAKHAITLFPIRAKSIC